jgi:hypothetical protein
MYFTSKFKEVCSENDFNSLYPFFQELKSSWMTSTEEIATDKTYKTNVEWLLNETEKVLREESSLIGQGFVSPLRVYTKLELLDGIKESWRCEVSTSVEFYWQNQKGLREYWLGFKKFINYLFYRMEQEIRREDYKERRLQYAV